MSKRIIMSTFHEFETDAGIIHHLINSQHGELSTSIIELACNGEDGGATEIRILITKDGFEVKDNGRGFQTEEEVMKYFKTFGLRHSDGDAKFGRFRIGRGQIMSFSDAIWKSNQFEMHSKDTGNKYGFDFVKHDEVKVVGCEVSGKFRKRISEYGVNEKLKTALQYMSIPIYLNGIKINAAEPEWDYEDEDVKITWKPKHADGVRIYSQGVLVKEIQEFMYGVCADICTKKALVLNMARNEVSHDDPLFTKIENLLLSESRKRAIKIHKGKNLNENLRRSLIKQLLKGELDLYDACKMSLLRDCRGHTVSLGRLISHNVPLTMCESVRDVRKGDFFATANLATVLHHNEMNVWGFDCLESFVEELISLSYNSKYRGYGVDKLSRLNIIEFDELSEIDHVDLKVIDNKDLTPREASARNAIQAASNTMAKRLANAGYDVDARKVIIGESYCADGWTDGISYISVSRHMLRLLESGMPGAFQLSLLLLHEYIHQNNSVDEPDHDFDFYKAYHDLSSNHKNEVVGNVAKTMWGRYQKQLHDKQLKDAKAGSCYKTDKVSFVVGDKGLSELAKILLKLNSFDVRIRAGKGTIHSNDKTTYDRNYAASFKIYAHIISEGYSREQFDYDEYDYHSCREAGKKMIKKWLTEKGHDNRDVIVNMIDNLKTSLDLIKLICEDQNSSIEKYEMFEPVLMHINGNDDCRFEHVTKNHGKKHNNINWYSRTPKDKFKTESSRLEEVKGAISDIFNGLNSKDKETFANTFFSEEFKKELNLA